MPKISANDMQTRMWEKIASWSGVLIPRRLYFKCPACRHSQVGPMEIRASFLRPIYKCDRCSKLASLKNPWLLAGLLGIAIAVCGVGVASALTVGTDNRLSWQFVGIGSLIVCGIIFWIAMPIVSKAICTWKPAEQPISD